MSGDLRFSVAVSEGVHDVMAIVRILSLKGFEEITTISQIPPPFHQLIRQQYPWRNKGQQLTWTVSHPSFLVKGGDWVLVSNAGGKSELAENLKSILATFPKSFTDAALYGAAILADADKKTALEKREELYDQLAEALADVDNFEFDPAAPKQMKRFGAVKPFDVYVFPDDQNRGTLEHILLDGARREYPDLLAKAEDYISFAKGLPCAKDLQDNFNDRKAVVGVIANALRPGKANQVSIHDNEWFTKGSLAALPLHQSLSRFIDSALIPHDS